MYTYNLILIFLFSFVFIMIFSALFIAFTARQSLHSSILTETYFVWGQILRLDRWTDPYPVCCYYLRKPLQLQQLYLAQWAEIWKKKCDLVLFMLYYLCRKTSSEWPKNFENPTLWSCQRWNQSKLINYFEFFPLWISLLER